MQWQIDLLHVQSKQSYGKAGLQPMHDSGLNFVMVFSTFFRSGRVLSLLRAARSLSAVAAWGDAVGDRVESHWRMFPFRANPKPRTRKEGRHARYRH